jgi:hypothetical protein
LPRNLWGTQNELFSPDRFLFSYVKAKNRTLTTCLKSPKLSSLELIHENFFLRPLDFQKYHIEVLNSDVVFEFLNSRTLNTYMKTYDFSCSISRIWTSPIHIWNLRIYTFKFIKLKHPLYIYEILEFYMFNFQTLLLQKKNKNSRHYQ